MQTKNELTDKLLRLHKSLMGVKKDKKIANSNYNDDIKEINKEIEAVIEAVDNLKSVWCIWWFGRISY